MMIKGATEPGITLKCKHNIKQSHRITFMEISLEKEH